MKKFYSLAQVAAATLFIALNFEALAQQTKYPSVQTTNTMTATNIMEISGKALINKETTLKEELILDKFKEPTLPANEDRLLVIDKFGKVNAVGETTLHPTPVLPGKLFPYFRLDGNILGSGGSISNPFIGSTDYSDLLFKTANTERARITASGNVNISAPLNVTGNIQSDGKISAAAFTGNSPLIFEAPDGTERMRIDDVSGNVGIGTSPTEKLEVNGNIRIDDDYDLLLRNSHHGLGWYGTVSYGGVAKTFAGKDVDGPVLYGFSGGALGTKQGTTQKIALLWNINGDVGIGTTAPQAPLHVSGSSDTEIKITNSANGSELRLMAVNSNGVVESHIQFKNLLRFIEPLSGVTRAMIDANGFHACKVKVEVLAGCDFVFENNYTLPSRKKRMDDILKYKHLPYIKPAFEMESEGMDVGETSLGILRNVEEHELYLYNHDERIELLEKENKELRELINGMKKEILLLKK